MAPRTGHSQHVLSQFGRHPARDCSLFVLAGHRTRRNSIPSGPTSRIAPEEIKEHSHSRDYYSLNDRYSEACVPSANRKGFAVLCTVGHTSYRYQGGRNWPWNSLFEWSQDMGTPTVPDSVPALIISGDNRPLALRCQVPVSGNRCQTTRRAPAASGLRS